MAEATRCILRGFNDKWLDANDVRWLLWGLIDPEVKVASSNKLVCLFSRLHMRIEDILSSRSAYCPAVQQCAMIHCTLMDPSALYPGWDFTAERSPLFEKVFVLDIFTVKKRWVDSGFQQHLQLLATLYHGWTFQVLKKDDNRAVFSCIHDLSHGKRMN